MEGRTEKVMFLCDYQAPYGGNFVPSLMALEGALAKRNVQVVYVFPEPARQRYWFQQLEKSGKTMEVFQKEQNKSGLIKDIRKLTSQYGITVLHTHFMSMSIVAALSFRCPKIKVIEHIHSDFSAGRQNWKLKLQRRLFYQMLARNVEFISVSKAFEKYNPKKITWVPNGLAVERIPSERMDAEQVRKNCGVADDELLAEIFAWSPVVKGLDIAVNAVKLINETEHCVLKLAIVCGRQMVPEKMRRWVADHTDCTGEEPFLIYLSPTEDVFSYHQAADMLISASRSEGFSYAILEMLSLGKRCVISDISGCSWAKKYAAASVFESENQEACAEAIRQAVAEMPKQNIAVADSVKEEYSIDKWTDAIIAQYKIEE